MDYDEILNTLSPCGLNCKKCFAYEDGEIRKYSIKLKEKLGNFAPYAKRFEELLDNPVFNKYSDFKIFLDHLVSENCKGCRKENCKLFTSCGVRSCHQEKEVDFCFQCKDFPCENTNFDKNLKTRWTLINREIQEKGLEVYYAETKDKPRY